MATTVRVAAARLLSAIERGDITLAAGVDRGRRDLVDPRDRGLLVELVAGTLRWQLEIDAMLETASRRPVDTLDPAVRAVLRLGAYQIRHLERIPAHAVVHDSVDAVRRLAGPRATGFVNAVLRAMLRDDTAQSLPSRPRAGAGEDEQLDYLSITLSHPRWLVRRWLRRHGLDATERWCQFNNASPSITIRPVPPTTTGDLAAELHASGVEVHPTSYAAGALSLPAGTLGRVSPAAAAKLSVQDEGSQLVAEFAGVVPPEHVIDLCAAPGGKTMMLAEALGMATATPAGQLVAGDHRRSRVRLLASRLRSRGLDIPVVALDARGPLPFGPVFDCVLLDAPCSGLGTLRRDPDLKWSRREEDQARFVSAQHRMIRAAAGLVRRGGRLVYATCSSEPEENAAVVEDFLSEMAGSFARGLPPPSIAAAVLDQNGDLRTEPFRHGLDGYFATRLVRHNGP